MNNLGKTYLYQPKSNLLPAAGASGVRVILSSVTATEDGQVNAHAININEHIEQCCMRN